MARPRGVTDDMRMERRKRAWELRTEKGWSQTKIADELGVSQKTISRDLSFWTDRVLEDVTKLVDREIKIQVAQLQVIVHQAMEAWEKSKAPRRSVRERRLQGETEIQGESVLSASEITVNVTDHVGSSAFLRTALQAMADIRKLLGMDSPTRFKIDWESELERVGEEDASGFFEGLVQDAYQELMNGSTGSTGTDR